MTVEERNDYLNALQDQRRSERTRIANEALAAGVDPSELLQTLAVARAQDDAGAAWVAAATEAEAARQHAEKQLAELEAERATRGRAAGELRLALHRFDEWAVANGQTTEAAA
jgi:hypothetical protein